MGVAAVLGQRDLNLSSLVDHQSDIFLGVGGLLLVGHAGGLRDGDLPAVALPDPGALEVVGRGQLDVLLGKGRREHTPVRVAREPGVNRVVVALGHIPPAGAQQAIGDHLARAGGHVGVQHVALIHLRGGAGGLRGARGHRARGHRRGGAGARARGRNSGFRRRGGAGLLGDNRAGSGGGHRSGLCAGRGNGGRRGGRLHRGRSRRRSRLLSRDTQTGAWHPYATACQKRTKHDQGQNPR